MFCPSMPRFIWHCVTLLGGYRLGILKTERGSTMKPEERMASAEVEKAETGLVGPSQRMVYQGPDHGLACRTCGTRVEEGWACGEKGCTIFWYCPTCDEFLEWSCSGLTEEMTEECQSSMKSFLRYIMSRPAKGEGNNQGWHEAGERPLAQ